MTEEQALRHDLETLRDSVKRLADVMAMVNRLVANQEKRICELERQLKQGQRE